MNIEEINTPDLNVFKPNSKNTLITTDEFFELWNKRNKYDKLQQALNEIREYCNTKISKSFKYDFGLDNSNPSDRLFTETVFELQRIQEIIDKALGGSDE